jgi:toxin ParE1/3/4
VAERPVVRSPASEHDLIDIWCTIAVDDPRAADRVLDPIAERILQSGDFPGSGPRRPEIAADARALTVGNYLVLYRTTPERVEILRIVHDARDVKTLL